MARVFTIAPGLENMGGLKTGGQGSVYKGRRTGEVITAVKILPTPIFSESVDNKSFITFESEVTKLKKVNETPNPYVVKMVGAGICDTGNFPFIEMEYIEGRDLHELLQPANHPIFTIAETIKVAEQLASALSHCHQLCVRHGDIKSSNIKLNSETGNYILLDFGLASMSDEQRRSSVGQAGAIEYMAPEQSTGQMLYQTDVYSYGIVLFELLTGSVPFALRDKSNAARNDVRLAHLVSPVPDLIESRRLALPLSWDDKKKLYEMQVPGWLVDLIYKCLEKKPGNRFADGSELHNYILQNAFSKNDNTASLAQVSNYDKVNESLLINHEKLKNELFDYRQELLKKEGELIIVKDLLSKMDEGSYLVKRNSVKAVQPVSKGKVVSKTSFTTLLIVTFALAAFAIVPVFRNKTAANVTTINPATANSHNEKNDNAAVPAESGTSATQTDEDNLKQLKTQQELHDEPVEKIDKQEIGKQAEAESVFEKPGLAPAPERPVQERTAQEKTTIQIPAEQNSEVKTTEQSSEEQVKQPAEKENQDKKKDKTAEENNENVYSSQVAVSKKYLVVSKAYFFNEADENTRRDEFISPFEHAVVQALNERYGFVYVVITNPQGQVFKGWLRKRDLKLFSIE